jgi:transposase-like protein
VAQHFLLSAAARSLSPSKVTHMSDRDAGGVFARLRWPETAGKPVCPRCGCQTCYDCRRSAHQPRWRCKACRSDFSITSDTLLAHHKLPLKRHLMAIAVFCNEVKGKSMLAFARDLDVQYKTAFVLAHKLREAMASSTHGLRLGGEARIAEVDGAYFGGHVRPENLAANRIDRRLAENRPGNRQVVMVMRERGGRTLAQVFAAEADAVATVRLRIAKGTTVHADENSAWNQLHATSAMRRVNHQAGYSVDGACTNGAESYFSRLRRGELGHHHHIAGPYLARYAQEAAWREDFRRASNGGQVHRVVELAMPAVGRFPRLLATIPGIAFKGATQPHAAKRLVCAATHGFPHGAIAGVQSLAPHQRDRDVVGSQRFAVCLAQRILASSAELARGEVRTPLARCERPD